MQKSKLSVTILTGFLGAGKTTVLNTILRSYTDKRIVVIENEFGERSIDKLLVAKEVDSSVFDLSSGCICCNLSSDLVDVLKQLLSAETGYSNLIIETTGIADPAGVIKPFLSDQVLSQGFAIDSVICVVDGKIAEEMYEQNKEAIQQVALADVVLINKSDLIDVDYLPELKDAIHSVNSYADIRVAVHGDSQTELLDIEKYSQREVGSFCLNFMEQQSDKRHAFVSEAVDIEGRFDFIQLKAWVHSFCFFNQRSVVRMKGYFTVKKEETEEIYILQVVRDSVSFELYTGDEIPSNSNRLIIIGTKVDASGIREALQQLLLPLS